MRIFWSFSVIAKHKNPHALRETLAFSTMKKLTEIMHKMQHGNKKNATFCQALLKDA